MKKKKGRKIERLIQFVTGIHRVHHIVYSYGWKTPLLKCGYFPGRSIGRKFGFKRMKGHGIDYHDCTVTGVY